MNRKNAQIKFGETFGVIIIVYIIIMVGMLWYNNYSSKQIAELNEENKLDKSFEKYYYIVNNNMLHLSQQGDIDEEFDLVSLRIFQNYSSQEPARERIRKQLGETLVELEVFEFDLNDDKTYNLIENITIYNNTPKAYKNREAFKSLIPVVDTIEKNTHIGVLSVYVYN